MGHSGKRDRAKGPTYGEKGLAAGLQEQCGGAFQGSQGAKGGIRVQGRRRKVPRLGAGGRRKRLRVGS